MSVKPIAMALALGVGMAVPHTAMADDTGVRVAYADLDLTTESGAAQLDNRIATAVRRACSTGQLATMDETTEASACRQQAMAEAEQARNIVLARARSGGENLAAADSGAQTTLR